MKIKILDAEFIKQYGLPELTESAGYDLRTTKDLIMLPDCTQLVGTGIAIHIDDVNIVGLIMPRSGLGHKEGLVLGNLTGVIDSDYQGELKLSLWNRTDTVTYYAKGDRVAQLVFVHIAKPQLEVVEEFTQSDRGSNGFGSTGSK